MNLKRTLITLFILSIGFNSYAQSEEEDQTTIFIPIRVAKQIQKDLIGKDSCEAMLDIAYRQIIIDDRLIDAKNHLIDSLKNSFKSINSQLENERALKITYKQIGEECNTQYTTLNSGYKGYKKFVKMMGFIGVAVVAGLTAVILFVK